MNPIEKETLLTLVRQNKELREKEEERVRGKQKYKEITEKFHKPVTTKLEESEKLLKSFEEERLDKLKGIENAIQNISLPALESTTVEESSKSIPESPAKTYLINIDEGLDWRYLRDNNFKLPSKLIGKSDEEINEMLEKSGRKGKAIGGQKKSASGDDVFLFEEEIDHGKLYRKRLKQVLEANQLTKVSQTGSGLDKLALLTDMIIRHGKKKELHNKIVEVLDTLLKDKTITNECVKKYYEKYLL